MAKPFNPRISSPPHSHTHIFFQFVETDFFFENLNSTFLISARNGLIGIPYVDWIHSVLASIRIVCNFFFWEIRAVLLVHEDADADDDDDNISTTKHPWHSIIIYVFVFCCRQLNIVPCMNRVKWKIVSCAVMHRMSEYKFKYTFLYSAPSAVVSSALLRMIHYHTQHSSARRLRGASNTQNTQF